MASHQMVWNFFFKFSPLLYQFVILPPEVRQFYLKILTFTCLYKYRKSHKHPVLRTISCLNREKRYTFTQLTTKQPVKVDKTKFLDKIKSCAEVAELADALRSGRSEPWAHEGSTPSFGMTPQIDLGGFRVNNVES
jgi:hypothetical protein